MSIDARNYEIVWKPIPPEWATFRITGPAPGVLPHFVSGEDCERHLDGKSITFDETMLFLGVLHAWIEGGPVSMAGDKKSQEHYFKRMLYNLCLRSGFDSLEVMVLTLSTRCVSKTADFPPSKC